MGAVLTLAAIGLAGVGQYVIASRGGSAGWWLYLVAALLLGVGVWLLPRCGGGIRVSDRFTARLPRIALILVGFGGQAYTVLFGLQSRSTWPAGVIWLLSLGALVASLSPTVQTLKVPRRPPRIASYVAGGLLLLLASGLRLVDLDGIPSGIHGDEGEFGSIALQILSGQGPPIFGVAFLDDPALYPHILAGFVSVFGTTITAIRLPSALAGIATVPLVWLLVRDMFGRGPAILAACFVAVSAVLIHFSRMALNVGAGPLFLVLTLWCFWRGVKTARSAWLLSSGLVAGLAFYFHFADRLIPLVLACCCALWLLVRWPGFGRWARSALLAGIGCTLAVGPLLLTLASNSNRLTDHATSRMIWTSWDAPASYYHLPANDYPGILAAQLLRTLESFNRYPDSDDFYQFAQLPLVGGVLAPVALLGLALLVVRGRDLRYAMLLAAFAVPFLLGNVLTVGQGATHRLLLCVVPVLIAAALLLDLAIRSALRWLPTYVGLVVAFGCAALVPIQAGWELGQYFGPGIHAYPWMSATAQARVLGALPPGSFGYVAGAPWIYADHGPSRFLGNAIVRRDLRNPTVELPVNTGGRPLTVVVNPGLEEWVPLLRSYYPGAEVQDVRRPGDRVAVTTVTIPASAQAATHPAEVWQTRIQPTESGKPAVVRQDPALVFHDLSLIAGTRSFSTEWRSVLTVPAAGEYAFELLTDGAVEFQVDGATVATNPAGSSYRTIPATVRLQPGEHTLRVQGGWTDRDGVISLSWRPPGGTRELVPNSALHLPRE